MCKIIFFTDLNNTNAYTFFKQDNIRKKTKIAKALFNSHSYSEYRKIVAGLLRGEIDWRYLSRGVTHYSGLNDAE
jgi:hypothetical protein